MSSVYCNVLLVSDVHLNSLVCRNAIPYTSLKFRFKQWTIWFKGVHYLSGVQCLSHTLYCMWHCNSIHCTELVIIESILPGNLVQMCQVFIWHTAASDLSVGVAPKQRQQGTKDYLVQNNSDHFTSLQGIDKLLCPKSNLNFKLNRGRSEESNF